MRERRSRRILALICAMGLAALWLGAGADPQAGAGAGAAGARPASDRAGTVACANAALGTADPQWRRRSTVAGPFGFYGSGRNFKKWAFRKTNGEFATKVPVVVEGSTPVTVRFSQRDAGRAGLQFGFGSGDSVETSFAEVRFEPCLNRSPTGFPGGFVLANRKPVKLVVQVEGSAEWQRIAVGKKGG